jgi:diguanylate cyclase (GGDEF)-like protein/PAS domain S-box-containing protein
MGLAEEPLSIHRGSNDSSSFTTAVHLSKNSSMARPNWTLRELHEFIGVRRLAARDLAGNSVPVPSSLDATANGTEWRGEYALVLPADRVQLPMAWWHALQSPNEPSRARLRIRRQPGADYRWEVVTFLNLLDDPEFGVILVVIETTDDPVVIPTADPEVHRPTTLAMIQYLDAAGQITDAHGDVEEIYGRSLEEMTSVLPLTLIHDEDISRLIDHWVALLANPTSTRQYTIRVPRPDGTEITLETTLLNRLSDPKVGAVIAVSHDVTEREARARSLDASERRFRRLVEQFPTPVFTANADGCIRSVSEPARVLLGASVEAPTYLWDLAAERDREVLRQAWVALGEIGEFDVQADDLTETRVLRFRANISTADASALDEILCTVDDVTAEVAELDALSWQATRDEQTNVANRTGLRLGWDRLRSLDRPIGVVFFDLDDFKRVNDSYGHAVGDEVLVEIGSRLRSFARVDEVVARFGGDEFVVLLSLSSPSDNEPAAIARLRDEICRPVLHGAGVWNAQVSVGYIEASPGESLESAVSRADRSMYEDKHRRKMADTAITADQHQLT